MDGEQEQGGVVSLGVGYKDLSFFFSSFLSAHLDILVTTSLALNLFR